MAGKQTQQGQGDKLSVGNSPDWSSGTDHSCPKWGSRMQDYSLGHSVVAPLTAQGMKVRGTRNYPLHVVKTQRRREKSHHYTEEEIHGRQQGFVMQKDREYQGRRP